MAWRQPATDSVDDNGDELTTVSRDLDDVAARRDDVDGDELVTSSSSWLPCTHRLQRRPSADAKSDEEHVAECDAELVAVAEREAELATEPVLGVFTQISCKYVNRTVIAKIRLFYYYTKK